MGGARSSRDHVKSSNRPELKLNRQFSRTLVIQWPPPVTLCSHQGGRARSATEAMNRHSVIIGSFLLRTND